MKFPEPVAMLSPAVMWHAALSGPQKFVLLGDCCHSDARILNEVTQAVPTLRRYDVGVLANECSPKIYSPIIEAFNTAGQQSRDKGEDVVTLKLRLACLNHGVGDLESPKNKALQKADFDFLVAARGQIQVHGIQFIPTFCGPDLLEGITPETRARLLATERYMTEHGDIPPIYQQNPALAAHDTGLIAKADNLLRKVNFDMDRERAQMFETIARPHKRAALFYGAGHFRGVGQNGIDAFLPTQQQVLIYISNADGMRGLDMQPSIAPPDFFLRVDEGRAYVQPSAIKKGLYPG